jgi:hypothetical protein
MSNETIGRILLGIGIIVMFYAVIQVVLVFTYKAEPFTFFETKVEQTKEVPEESGSDLSNLLNGSLGDLKNSVQPNIQILPTEAINGALNLAAHYFLMTFLLGFGHKLATLGISLMQRIYVKTQNTQ